MNEEHVTIRRVAGDPRPASVSTTSVVHERVTRSPGGAEVARRIVVFLFGLIQLSLGLRVVLLVLAADRANDVVRAIYDVSAPLVAPFEGILRTDAIHASGSILDLAAVVALVGWTIVELVVLAAVHLASTEA